jgi:hypothetical protein
MHTKEDVATETYIRALHFYAVRKLPSGEWAALRMGQNTVDLCTGIQSDGGCDRRWCYIRESDAIRALRAWDGSGNPSGHWVMMRR